MSFEFATHLANFATEELVLARKELRCINDRYQKLYNEHENLKEAMLEMEKKMRELEQTVASQDEELARHREWSSEYILREMYEEMAKGPSFESGNIEMLLNAKYTAACQIEEIKSRF